ncbi:MAG: hypothetical protein MI923_30805 [Phycisphaerales bacterium]|nr:hypothetical protein [Phycisphaerales bacterium]
MKRACGFIVAILLVTTVSTIRVGAEEQTPQNIRVSQTAAFEAVRQEARLKREFAESAFLYEHPEAKLYKLSERTTRIYGKAFSYGESAVAAAERFCHVHSDVFGVGPDELRPASRLMDGRHTQPVMYQPETGTYKFTLVCYTQHKEDIPVFRADLRLLARNEAGSPVVLASSALRDLAGLEIGAAMQNELAKPEFIRTCFAACKEAPLNASPDLLNFTEPRVVIWAGVDDMVVEPKLALEFIADNFGPNSASNNKQLYVTDLQTGEILYQESRVFHVDGNVSGVATEGIGTDECEPESSMALPYIEVTSGANSTFADENGNFSIVADGPTVDASLNGQWFDALNFLGAEVTASESAATPVNFLFNAANTDEQVRAQVNGYLEANRVRDFVAQFNPSYPTFTDTDIPVTVNRTDGFCPANAWYSPNDFDSPTGYSINFCVSNGGDPNTAWSSVVHHEFGHHIVEAGGSGQGQYGEGMGDVMSTLILDSNLLGLGFFGDCGSSLRNADNSLEYPCSGSIHFCGQVISGCVWDTRNELVITNPGNYIEILGNLMVNSVLLHTGTLITPQITIDVLTLDDDNADLTDGTPHCMEICTGFAAHNMDCPAFGVFDYPSGRPDLVVPEQTTVIPVSVATGPANVPTVSHRIGTSGPFTTEPMVLVSPGEYEATLPAADCLETIEYFVSADGACIPSNDPLNAPSALFSAIVATSSVTAAADDFETDQGWTVTDGAGLGDGTWQRGAPVGGGDRGDPPTDFDGSGQCWLTNNGDGNTDVDNGTTTLTSPVFDLSGLQSPQLSYARWFSNNTGGGPETDTFVVEISDNGGGSWTNLETVGPTTSDPNPEVTGGWFMKTFTITPSSQFRIRFTAQDVDPQSVVEAGVDAFSIVDFECVVAPCAGADGDLNDDGDVNGEDIQSFVNALLGSPTPDEVCHADFNDSNGLDAGDVDGMVNALLAP